jgi:hypothetical protein
MDRIILKHLVIFCFSFNFLNAQTIVDLEGIETGMLKTKIETNTAKLLKRINTAYRENSDFPDYSDIQMSDEAKVNINQLWATSPFLIQETEIYEKLLHRQSSGENSKKFEIRNIRMYFKNAEKEDRNQQGVISFNKNGELIDFYISIGYKLYKNVMIEGKTVKDLLHRQIILDFVESFRTAYNRKDISFIEKVFSDEALIIVGNVVKLKSKDKDFGTYEKTTYTVKSKKKYMSGLKRAFNRNEYINIVFDDLKLVRHYKYKHMYGITVKQDWNSTTYSDKGYVFLMIDLKEIDNPIIHIRTWDAKDSFNLENFPIGEQN